MKKHILILSTVATPLWAEAPKVVTDIAPVHALTSLVMEGVGEPELIIPLNASPHNFAMRPTQARALSQADVVVWIGHGLTPWLEGPIESLAGDAKVMELMEVEGVSLLPFREGALFEGDGHDHGAEDDHDDHDNHDDHADHAEDHDDHDHAKKDEDHAEHAEDHKDHDHAAHDEDHKDHDHAEHDKDHKDDDHAAHDEDHKDHDHAEHDEDHKDHDHAKHDDDHKDEDHAADSDGHDGHDHASHGDTDPHIWLDPANAAVFLDAIAAELSAVDPDNAATYAANAAKGRVTLSETEAQVNALLEDARGMPFIVLHDAFHYFEHHFEVEAIGAISVGDASAPGAARIAALREALPASGLKCAFSEPQTNGRIIETVIEGMSVQTAILDPLGADLDMGPTLYPALLIQMATSMSECLTR